MLALCQPVALTGATQTVASKRYFGLVARETAGAVATIRVWDGPASTGILVDDFGLAANGVTPYCFYPGGIYCASGTITVEKVAGTFEGSIRVG